MRSQVRFDRMVPADVVARRRACNLAYLPVGSLEWHGEHMPFGTDYFTVTYIAERAARRFGGVVFPPIYYNDVRYLLHESRAEWKRTYARSLEVPLAWAEAFPVDFRQPAPACCPTQPDDGPLPPPEMRLEFTHDGQALAFARHIAQVLLEIHLYGFKNIVLLPGHAPNLPGCRQAEEIYRANVVRRRTFGPPARTVTWFYISAITPDVEPMMGKIWLHADKWEGSVVMAAAPGTVRLDRLPQDPQAIPPAFLGVPYLTETDGYNPNLGDLKRVLEFFDPRNDTNSAYGRKQVNAVLKALGRQVREMIGGPSGGQSQSKTPATSNSGAEKGELQRSSR